MTKDKKGSSRDSKGSAPSLPLDQLIHMLRRGEGDGGLARPYRQGPGKKTVFSYFRGKPRPKYSITRLREMTKEHGVGRPPKSKVK